MLTNENRLTERLTSTKKKNFHWTIEVAGAKHSLKFSMIGEYLF